MKQDDVTVTDVEFMKRTKQMTVSEEKMLLSHVENTCKRYN